MFLLEAYTIARYAYHFMSVREVIVDVSVKPTTPMANKNNSNDNNWTTCLVITNPPPSANTIGLTKDAHNISHPETPT